MKQKTLRKDAHSAQGKMVAKATAPRRENVPGHILFCMIGNVKYTKHTKCIKQTTKKASAFADA